MINHIMDIITPLPDTNNFKNIYFILDPLSTIIKLAIISKKNIGCKISIKNNIISIQKVGIFQGIVRYYFNDNKNDVHYMLNSIEYACINFINKNKKINRLFKSSVSGLQKLIDTYKEFPIIVHCLNFYISIINNYISGTNINEITPSELYTPELLILLNNRWSDSKISIIIEMIDYINNNEYTDTSYIESFMNGIDYETQAIIKNYFPDIKI